MKTLIFEGIATSGKSTIIDKLVAELSQAKTVKIVPETETLLAIVDNTDKDVSISHLKTLIGKVYEEKYDVVVFDRLYLTQIFRTHSEVMDYHVIEDMLNQFSPTTIFLKVDEAAIAIRVEKASQHRVSEWKEYIETKGNTIQEIADYYIKQQRNQERLLQDSTLPHIAYNTTNHDYEKIVKSILTGVLD
jgi:thymidylate kinase